MNHFPCTRAAGLTELAKLRKDIDTSRASRAKQLAAEQAMLTEAAVLERALIADIASTKPPNAVTADTTGALWQAAGGHLRVVPRTDATKVVAVPAPEPLLLPPMSCAGPCECLICTEAMAAIPTGGATHYTLSIQDWSAGGMPGRRLIGAVDAAERDMCGGCGNGSANGYHQDGEC